MYAIHSILIRFSRMGIPHQFRKYQNDEIAIQVDDVFVCLLLSMLMGSCVWVTWLARIRFDSIFRVAMSTAKMCAHIMFIAWKTCSTSKIPSYRSHIHIGAEREGALLITNLAIKSFALGLIRTIQMHEPASDGPWHLGGGAIRFLFNE